MTNEEIKEAISDLQISTPAKPMTLAEFDRYMFIICEVIDVLKQTRWIPVSERLPEEFGGDYLVTIEYKGEVEGIDQATYIPGGYIDGLWDTDCDWIEGPSEYWHVTAWMPLPQPYKTESEE